MAKLTVHRASVYPYGGKIYMPGEQEIDGKDADSLLGKSGIKKDIAAGIISIEKTRGRKPKQEYISEPTTPVDQPDAE